VIFFRKINPGHESGIHHKIPAPSRAPTVRSGIKILERGLDPCECDLNGDGKCDMLDWLLFGEDWGRTDCPIP
jgi:hypothetical protein